MKARVERHPSPRRQRPEPEPEPQHRLRLRAEYDTGPSRSRPCTPCLKAGRRVAATRILGDGSGRCEACYAENQK